MATVRVICFALLSTGLLVGSAFAQDDNKPLNLTLPPSTGFPAPPVASAAPAKAAPTKAKATGTAPASTPPAGINTAPGVY